MRLVKFKQEKEVKQLLKQNGVKYDSELLQDFLRVYLEGQTSGFNMLRDELRERYLKKKEGDGE